MEKTRGGWHSGQALVTPRDEASYPGSCGCVTRTACAASRWLCWKYTHRPLRVQHRASGDAGTNWSVCDRSLSAQCLPWRRSTDTRHPCSVACSLALANEAYLDVASQDSSLAYQDRAASRPPLDTA